MNVLLNNWWYNILYLKYTEEITTSGYKSIILMTLLADHCILAKLEKAIVKRFCWVKPLTVE